MPLTVTERQEVLNDLNTLAVRDITDLWRDASPLGPDQFRGVIARGLPELIDPYAAMAADLSATWYEESAPDLAFRATPAPLAPAEQFEASARWALRAAGEAALVRLAGTAQRAIFGAYRETIVGNVRTEQGSRWARHASANACAFCRMLATRQAVYSTEAAAYLVGAERWEAKRNYKGQKVGFEIGRPGRTRGTQEAGARYHDHCRCMAVEVRPGQSYEPPPYVEQWEADYIAASRDTDGSTKAVLAHMDGTERGRRATAAAAAPARTPKAGTGGAKPPIKPPTGGQAVSGAAGDDRPWRVPEDQVPEKYPELVGGGGKVHFLPKDRPDVETKRVHILVGDDKGGGHGHGAGKGKTEFTDWSDDEVLAAIDLTLAAPHSVQRVGSKLFFRRMVNDMPVEVLVAARKPTPTLQTGYPNKDALNTIKKGKGQLLWGV